MLLVSRARLYSGLSYSIKMAIMPSSVDAFDLTEKKKWTQFSKYCQTSSWSSVITNPEIFMIQNPTTKDHWLILMFPMSSLFEVLFSSEHFKLVFASLNSFSDNEENLARQREKVVDHKILAILIWWCLCWSNCQIKSLPDFLAIQ